MIRIDDLVVGKTRVLVKPDYARMAKDFWLYEEKWRDQDEAQGECLVIGGVYSVWRTVGASICLEDKYRRYEAPHLAGVDHLVLAADMQACRFKVGDWVRPTGSFEFKGFQSELPNYFDAYFGEAGRSHRVTGLLNRHFMFIDFPALSEL